MKKDFSLKNISLLNFDYLELVSRSKLHISSLFTCRGIWHVVLEPSKGFKKCKGHTCPGTLTQNQTLCYSAETKPISCWRQRRREGDNAAFFWVPDKPFCITGMVKFLLWAVRRATSPHFSKAWHGFDTIAWGRGGILIEKQQLKVCTSFSVA